MAKTIGKRLDEYNFSAQFINRMAKKAKNVSSKTIVDAGDRKLRHKLNSVKNEFESGKIKSFEQIFAIVGPSIWSKKLNMGYTTFINKSNNPADFTNGELIRFAEILNIEVVLIVKFVFSLIKPKVIFNIN